MKRTVILASSIGFIGSILSVAVAYTDWYLIDTSVRDALEPVWKWQIFGLSFLLTSLSLAVPFVAHYFRGREGPEANIILYAFAFLWLPFFVFHPGVRALGVTSDGAAVYAWFGVCFFQYVTARLMFSAIKAHPADSAGVA